MRAPLAVTVRICQFVIVHSIFMFFDDIYLASD